MARTTDDAVRLILGNEVEAETDLNPFMEIANELVTEVLAEDETVTHSETRLEMIERWLSAHFYKASLDPMATSERAGSVGASYQSETGLVLFTSHYGQHACLLDTSGKLAALSKATEDGKKRKVGVHWLGTECDSE